MNLKSHIVAVNGINLHYLEYPGKGPTILLMHGLTANAHAFDGLIAAGLSPKYRVISVDLRGRGLSDKPNRGYTIPNHARDIIGLLDHLQLDQVIMGGHSFGGLLTVYMAKKFPKRVAKMLLIDAAAQMHPNTREMLGPAMGRLGQTYPSFEAYLEKIKAAPYNTFWDAAMLSYYQADVEFKPDGTVTPRSQLNHMAEAVFNVLKQPWPLYLNRQHKPALLVNATGVYTLGAALLPEENARETCALMQNCQYVAVEGNHHTMLYGAGTKQTVKAIKKFLKETA